MKREKGESERGGKKEEAARAEQTTGKGVCWSEGNRGEREKRGGHACAEESRKD